MLSKKNSKNHLSAYIKLLTYLLYTSSISRKKTSPKNKKTVLFSWLMSMGLTKQLELMVMMAMLPGDVEISVVVTRLSMRERLLSLMLKRVTFHSTSEALTQGVDKHLEEEANEIIGKNSIREMLLYAKNGCFHGRNALSTLIRRLRLSYIDLNHSETKEALKRALLESSRFAEVFGLLLSKIKPDHVVFVEKGYSPAAELYNLCIRRKIDVVQWIGSPVSDSIVLKRYRDSNMFEHPLSLSKESIRQVSLVNSEVIDEMTTTKIITNYNAGTWFNRQNLNQGKRYFDKAEIVDKLLLDPSKKIAVIFSHIFYDATFFYGENLYEDYKEWLVETVRIARENPRLNWVIKVHPVNVWRSAQDGTPLEQLEEKALLSEFGSFPGHIFILGPETEISTHSLFDSIDVGITVRGTVGLELPCFGIPTITAGTGRYSGNGFTIDPRSKEDYRALLLDAHNLRRLTNEEVMLAKRYACASFGFRSIELQSIELCYSGEPPYLKIIKPLRNWTRTQFQDIEKISSFIINSSDEDYLEIKLVSH